MKKRVKAWIVTLALFVNLFMQTMPINVEAAGGNGIGASATEIHPGETITVTYSFPVSVDKLISVAQVEIGFNNAIFQVESISANKLGVNDAVTTPVADVVDSCIAIWTSANGDYTPDGLSLNITFSVKEDAEMPANAEFTVKKQKYQDDDLQSIDLSSSVQNTSVTVKKQEIPATGIQFAQKEVVVLAGSYGGGPADVTPENTTDSVTYTSSDTNVVTVDQDGRVYGVAIGQATITAQIRDLSANITVNVICGHKNTTTTQPSDPTCNTAGTKGYVTCNDCNKVFTSSDCQTETSVEAQKRPATGEHNYVAKYDDSKHWQECTACKTKKDEGAHNFENFVSETQHGKECTVCKKTADVADHVFDQTSVQNGTTLASAANCVTNAKYYYTCSCGKVGTETYEKPDSVDMNNHVMEGADTAWKTDGTSHWKVCANGHELNKANHTGGSATCKDKAVCEVCQQQYGELSTEHTLGDTFETNDTDHWKVCSVCNQNIGTTAHSFTVKNKDKVYLKTAANCQDDAVYFCSCECGIKGTTTFVDEGSKSGLDQSEKEEDHKDVSTNWTYDADGHWNKCVGLHKLNYASHDYTTQSDDSDHWERCTVCGYETEKQGHAGGVATCTEKAKCSTCNTAYGSLKAHDYSVQYFDETNHWMQCSVCQGKDTTTEKAHYDFALCYNDTNHWEKCAGCGYTKNEAAHAGGNATCQAKAVCKTCNIVYGELAPHKYTELNHTNEKHWYTCSVCEGVDADSTVEHTEGCKTYVIKSDADNHWNECSVCKYTTEHETHTGGTATCTDKKACTVCGTAYGDLLPHDFTKPNFDEINHWVECTMCALHKEGTEVAHTLSHKKDEKQHWDACDDCAYVTTKTDHDYEIKYDIINPENGHWKACKDENCQYTTAVEAHSYATLKYDDKNHWYACDICGVKNGTSVVAHKGGVATCVDKAVCEVCKQSYGELDATNHIEEAKNMVGMIASSVDKEGYTGDVICDKTKGGCGAVIEKGKVSPKVQVVNKEITVTSISKEIVAAGIDTVEKVENKLLEEIAKVQTKAEKSNTSFVEISLDKVYDTATAAWVEVTEEQKAELKNMKITVMLPYPEGTNKTDYKFTVAHMFSMTNDRHEAGDVETPEVTLTDNGIITELDGLSPVAISWVYVATATPEPVVPSPTPEVTPSVTEVPSSPKTSDVMAIYLFAIFGVVGAGFAARALKKKK